MLRNRKILFLTLALLMASAVFISGGCGGGSSGLSYILPTSEEDSSDDGGWIVPIIPESPDNDGGGNNDEGSGGSENFSPYSFNGTWEIIDGKLTLPYSNVIGTYSAGEIKPFEIVVTLNTANDHYGKWLGDYTILLKGENVVGHIETGESTFITVPFDIGAGTLQGFPSFKFENGNTLMTTLKIFYDDFGVNVRPGVNGEYKYTLLDDSTIYYTFYEELDPDVSGQESANYSRTEVELTLKRVK